jgi:Tfp pilus assembly protein PilX
MLKAPTCRREQGQAVLIVLLTAVVALTVVLSVISSTSSDIKISTNEAASQRAFSAAESGIQKALITNSNSSGSVNSGAQYDATVTSLAQGEVEFVYPNDIVNGDNAIFWFTSHDANGNLTCTDGTCYTGRRFNIYWGDFGTPSNSATTPAIEISIYYLATPGDNSTARVTKLTVDPNISRITNNSFASPNDPCNSSPPCTMPLLNEKFAFRQNIDLLATGSTYNVANGPQFVSVKLLYNTDKPTKVAIQTDNPLPSQGSLVESVGNLSTATRKVQVSRGYGGLPSVFDTAVYSEGGLSQ